MRDFLNYLIINKRLLVDPAGDPGPGGQRAADGDGHHGQDEPAQARGNQAGEQERAETKSYLSTNCT